MAIKKLLVEEMNQISAPWVAEGSPSRALIEKIALLSGLMPRLLAAHAGILALRTQAEDPKVRELIEREAALDAQHDDLVRGIVGALSALAEVSGGRSELLRLRDLLFPDGFAHTQRTYRAEAGHAAVIATHMDADLQARLKAVNLHDKNLLDLVNSWLDIARQLGELEDERAKLVPPPTSGSETVAARWAWVRAANALVANAELAGLGPDDDRLLFAALRAAERAAYGRGRGKTDSTEPQPPQPPPTPAAS